jgi:hypothetical protein
VGKPDVNLLKVIDVVWHLHFRKWNIFLRLIAQMRQFAIRIHIDPKIFQTDILRPFM